MKNKLVLTGAIVALSLVIGCADGELGAASDGPDQDLDPGDSYTSSDWISYEGYCVKHGNVAVDGRTGTTFVVQAVKSAPCNAAARRALFAIPKAQAAVRVMDVTGREDIRITFPEDRVLIMAESNGVDDIFYLDPIDLRITAKLRSRARYHASRTSPSRRFVTVADNPQKTGALHVIDTREFVTTVIPHNGTRIEAQWLNHRDMLVAIVFYGQDGGPYHAQILGWSFDDTDERPLYRGIDGGVWERPALNVRVDDVLPARAAPWIRVRDDDTWASFLAMGKHGEDVVLTLDIDGATVGVNEHVSGPAVWVADGRLAGWRMDEAGVRIVLVDPRTLSEEGLGLMPSTGRPTLVSHPYANHVLAFQAGDAESFTIFDIAKRKPRRLFARHHLLSEAASLGEDDVWFVAGDRLNRVDLGTGDLAEVGLGTSVRRLTAGEDGTLVLTSGELPAVLRLDPETMAVETIDLPILP